MAVDHEEELNQRVKALLPRLVTAIPVLITNACDVIEGKKIISMEVSSNAVIGNGARVFRLRDRKDINL